MTLSGSGQGYVACAGAPSGGAQCGFWSRPALTDQRSEQESAVFGGNNVVNGIGQHEQAAVCYRP
ncbi:hypothetical protein GCM10017711_01450 [Paeniglutamicibacter sulfureus]